MDKLGNNKEDILGMCMIHLQKVKKKLLHIPSEVNWYNLENVVQDNKNNMEVRFASRLHLRVCLDEGYHVLDESIYYSSDFRTTSKLLWPPTIGVFELGILNATGLLPMKSKDGRVTTDAYCVAKYEPKWPLFSQMHYLLSLSLYQVESLRHQATHTLSLRLSRAEPPLRREVVEYMLDLQCMEFKKRQS
ncbi:hypothetical protein CRYUN_Cryun21dG0035900 [Craigia yunnanensis]